MPAISKPSSVYVLYVGALALLLSSCSGGGPTAPEPVASVVVSPPTASVVAGQTVQLTATTRGAQGNLLTGRRIFWSSSNTGVATVDSTGLVAGVAPGTATITATSEGKNGTAIVTVTPVPVASVSVSPASATVEVGESVQLTATVKDVAGNTLTGRTITWQSSDRTVASVDSNGLVTGAGEGSATITATSEGKSGTATITVTRAAVASVIVSPASATIEVGETIQLTATVTDSRGDTLTNRSVTWSSSDVAVATVNSTGLVEGVAQGTATITAFSEGKNGTATITVTAPTAPDVGAVNDVTFMNDVGTGTLATPSQTEEYILAPYSLGAANDTFSYSVGTAGTGSGGLVAGLTGFGFSRLTEGTVAPDLEIRIRQAAQRILALRPQEIRSTFVPFQEPSEGDTLQFRVRDSLDNAASCDTVTAVLKRKSTNTSLFVDTEVTETELTDADASKIGTSFDPGSYGLVRDAFGTESDVNSDAHVTVLLTPAVNRLTPPGEAQEKGFIGGFFNPLDLFRRTTSDPCRNEQEIFYSFVPDPTNRWGNTFSKSFAISSIKGTLPHEFEHMINFNQHWFVARCNCFEEAWLDEGLAHVAEDVGGFPESNRGRRTELFLEAPHLNTLLTGGRILAERGAIYLFVRRLADVIGGDILLRLTSTGQTGRTNVTNKVGRPFVRIFRNWVATLFLSNRGLNNDPLFNFTSFDFVATFGDALVRVAVSLANPDFSSQVVGHAAQFLELTGATTDATRVEITGQSASQLQAIVIRAR